MSLTLLLYNEKASSPTSGDRRMIINRTSVRFGTMPRNTCVHICPVTNYEAWRFR